jgi:hypothetical protein
MEFVATDSAFAPEVKTLVEQRQCLSFRELVGFFFADQDLDLASHKTAD